MRGAIEPTSCCEFVALLQNQETISKMGVQGAKPFAGGTGVPPESLPFFYTLKMGNDQAAVKENNRC
jgi:hypothetical protein